MVEKTKNEWFISAMLWLLCAFLTGYLLRLVLPEHLEEQMEAAGAWVQSDVEELLDQIVLSGLPYQIEENGEEEPFSWMLPESDTGKNQMKSQ